MNEFVLALILGIALLLLLFTRLEIAFAIGIIGFAWAFISGFSPTSAVSQFFSGMDLFVLLAIPFFILVGEFMNASTVTHTLVKLANLSVGRMRGGLAQANITASLLFSGLSGSANADVAALGTIFIPSMAEEGYDRGFSAAVTAASALIGPIIPPSIIIVIYGGVTSTSIGALFAAAIIPGILLGLGLMVSVVILSRRRDYPKYVPDGRPKYPNLFVHMVLGLTVPAIILIGIIGGYMTATEAAAVGAVYAFLLGAFVYRTIKWKNFEGSFRRTIILTTQIYVIIGFAFVLTWVLAREGILRTTAAIIEDLGIGAIGFMLLVAVFLVFVGTWLEVGAAVIMLAPSLFEIAMMLGVHPYQFGMITIIAINFGLITPPVGICLFTASAVGKTPVWDIAKKILPFYIVHMAILLLLILYPPLTVFLPEFFGY